MRFRSSHKAIRLLWARDETVAGRRLQFFRETIRYVIEGQKIVVKKVWCTID